MNDEEMRNAANMDQNIALITDLVPRAARCMYDNLKREGFSDEHAFRIVLAYVHGSFGGKFN